MEAAGNVAYDLGANTITYDCNLWSGSGQNIDMGVYIPEEFFSSGFAADSYVYLYAEFGTRGGIGSKSGDGFEEYVLRSGGAPVPESGAMLLLGSGLIALAGFGRKKTKR